MAPISCKASPSRTLDQLLNIISRHHNFVKEIDCDGLNGSQQIVFRLENSIWLKNARLLWKDLGNVHCLTISAVKKMMIEMMRIILLWKYLVSLICIELWCHFLAALAALYLTLVSDWLTDSLTATLEFWHKEWLLTLETLETFDQHDV